MKENFFNSKPKISDKEIDYKNQEKELEDSHLKILTNLEFRRNEITEKDRIRLTRVLQLIQKYRPDRIVPEQEQKLIDVLKDLYRFLPTRKKKNKEVFIKPNDNPYLLAEETIEALRKLRHCDFAIEKFQSETLEENKILKQEINSPVVSKEILDTSLTLEYEKKNWGVDRICLDGIQNHLKTDSGGQEVWAQCLVDGVWISTNEAKNKQDKIKEVRFVDDGVGFDVKNLVLLWSTKSDEEQSRGQFGEGLKMVAASSVREDLDMELQSQNWTAKPFSKKIEVNNTRKNIVQRVGQLSFEVKHYDKKEGLMGSRTIFHKPSKEFIGEVLKINNKVLELSKDYKPLFIAMGERGSGDIVNKDEGNIFVKGIFVKKENSIFSYNFNDVETNRDRNAIVNSDINDRIHKVIYQLNDKRLIKSLLQKSLEKRDAIECTDYYMNIEFPELWKESFYEAYGQNACLKTDFESPDVFKEQEETFIKVELTDALFKMLKRVGVKTDKEALPSYQETISTSVTLEYGKDIWKEERILLDAIQNHLPQDAEGGSMFIRFKTKDGQWHDFKDLKEGDYEDDYIETIKIANEGNRGYDCRLLGIFQSIKDTDQSSGKWGEGLKMLSAACLRGGINLSLKSRNWQAIPKVQEQNIDDKKIQQLVFDVVHDLNGGENSYDNDYHSKYEQSATIFNNPNKALIEEFRNADKKVLALSEKRKLSGTENGDILELKNGEMFVRGILIPGEHGLRYSYHLSKFDIKTRDRNNISEEDLKDELGKIWSEVRSPEVIKDFLYQASILTQSGQDDKYIEFRTRFNPENSDLWIKAFKDIFGESTAIRNVSSQNFNEIHQLEHVGLSVVTMPNKICWMLNSLLGANGEKIDNYSDKIKELTDVNFIQEEEITNDEKKVIELLYKVGEFLPNNTECKIKIYERKFIGQNIALGFSHEGGDVSLFRDVLSNTLEAIDVFYHEKTHSITGASDADEGFRNFLTRALAELALKQFELNKVNSLSSEIKKSIDDKSN